MRLLTLGYEGLRIDSFFDILIRNGVQTVVDVREHPISRKPGFSKSDLAAAAARRGLSYIHVPALGSPKEIRHEYHTDGDWQRFSRRFLDYLATQEDAIAELADIAQRTPCCLLCFEADPRFCHRSFVAQRVAQSADFGISVDHLMV